ncbi:MAG: hypothetical protein NTV11_20430 [Rhodocyclales bacterium]|nr:hypothetical protein [Rhodocyclales bacterium]
MRHNQPPIIKFVIPALPGFFTLSPLLDEPNRQVVEASKEPIVGWAVDELNVVYPMSPIALELDAGPTLCPDGTVLDVTGQWESLDAWLAEQKSKREVLY